MGKLSEKTMKIVLGGVMVALASVLSLIKIFQLPYGGAITLCSMLPILFYAYRYGFKWGFFVGFVYSVIQFVLGTGAIRGFTFFSALGVVFFDFLLAFSILGVACLFRTIIKNNTLAFGIGSAVAMILRLCSHVISGVIFFGTYAEWYFTQDGMEIGEWVLSTFSGTSLIWIYSVAYNASYMLPELLLTVVVGCLMMKLIEKQLFAEENKITNPA